MSRRKKRKTQNGSSQAESASSKWASNITSEPIGAYLYKRQARKLYKKIKAIRAVLFGYCYNANIIRWATENRSEHYYHILCRQWKELDHYAGRLDYLITEGSLKYSDPKTVFLAMVVTYLTDRWTSAVWCAEKLLKDATFAWSGHSKSLVALITAMVNGGHDFDSYPDLDSYREDGNSLVDEVAGLWDFENGVGYDVKHAFAPLNRHTDDETDSFLPTLREICLAVMDKYDVDYAFHMPEGEIEYIELD